MLICSICKCRVTELYRHPLGDEEITCWFHADYFYVQHPERLSAARFRHADVPNF